MRHPTLSIESALRRAKVGFLVLVMGAVTACGGDSVTSTTGSASLAGTYTLRTINGTALPFVLQSGTNSITVTADAITVADGGTWSESGAYRQTINGQTTSQVISDGGTWTRAGASVAFSSRATTGYSGTFTGSGFSLTDNSGAAFVFTR
jgi:hypothetical protein